MRDLLSAFRSYLAARYAPRSVVSYVRIVEHFGDAIGPADLSARKIDEYLVRPLASGAPRSAATRNQELSAIRAWCAFLVREAKVAIDPSVGIAFLPEKRRDPAVPTPGEVRELFLAGARLGDAHERALALTALLFGAGLRVHEAVGLDLDQIDVATGTAIGVRGKGGTVCDVPLAPEVAELVGAWIAKRGGEPGPLFPSARSGRLSVRAVQRLLVRLRDASGTKKRLTPHSLRHACATLSIAMGTDLVTTSMLLRHESVRTTQRYVSILDEQRRVAVARLGSAIPHSILPTLKSAENRKSEGVAIAGVDVHEALNDIGELFDAA